MSILTQDRNYLPIDIETKYHSCLRRVESHWPIRKILSFYHVKRSSLYRWLKKFDGTKESLVEHSHRPISDHPNKLKPEIVKKILNLHRRNPSYSFLEVWAIMMHDGYITSASSVLRTFKRTNNYITYTPAKKKHDKVYHTPKMAHDKWQIDVKFVPKECKASNLEGKYYQYTIIDEATRKRALYFTNEHSMYETVQALKYAYKMFHCFPKLLQSDNGLEFTDKVRRKEKGLHIRPYSNFLEEFLAKHDINHYLIRPRTPQHNGKVERSHRIDQDKFYRNLQFFSLEDLKKQGLAWNKRYNNMPKCVLGFKTPNEVELELLKKLMEDTGEVRCPKHPTSIES